MAFVQRPLELRANHLLEDAVEVGRHLRGEERAAALGETAPRLQEVGHVKRAPGAIPVEKADRVIAHRVEYALTRLAVSLEARGRCGTVQHLRFVRDVPDERAEL